MPLRQGLPQGSPLLFKLYLNDLKTFATNDVEFAMLADNVLLFSSHPCKLTAHAAMLEAVTRVAKWNRHHKMTLNTEKCEVAFFTNNLHEARWQPTVHLEHSRLGIMLQT